MFEFTEPLDCTTPPGVPLIPKDLWLPMMVVGIVGKETKSGFGESIEFQIIDGEYSGWKIFQFYNFKHPNPETEKISNRQIQAIGHAVGIQHLQSTEQLLNMSFLGRIGIEAGSNGFPDKNIVANAKSIHDMAPSAPATEPPAQTAAAAPKTGAAKPQWRK